MSHSWLISLAMILGMVAVTYSVRLVPFLTARIDMPGWLLNVLNKIPAAVLAALVSVPVLEPSVTTASVLQPELLAAVLALLLGWSGLHLLWTVVISMAVYWLLNGWL
jgi:branched-subunit amino acid transport protein